MEGYSLQGNIFLIKNTVLYETIKKKKKLKKKSIYIYFITFFYFSLSWSYYLSLYGEVLCNC